MKYIYIYSKTKLGVISNYVISPLGNRVELEQIINY